MKTTYFLGTRARKAPPTKKHVPAIWECMLGAVYARNAQGETRYFDYDYEAARLFAGLGQDKVDIRVARARMVDETTWGVRRGQYVLWIRRPVQISP